MTKKKKDRMKRFPKVEEFLTEEGKPIWNERNLEAVTNIVKVVINKHFRLFEINEELIQNSLVRVIECFNNGEFDHINYGTTSGIKNFIYTVARNEGTRYIYHYSNGNKEIRMDIMPESLEEDIHTSPITLDNVISFLNETLPKFPYIQRKINPIAFESYLVKRCHFAVSTDDLIIDVPSYDYHLDKLASQFTKYYFKNLV